MHELANGAPAVTRAWQALATQLDETKVAKISQQKTFEQEQLADANATLEDLRKLARDVAAAKSEMARARREGVIGRDVTDDELKRLNELEAKVQTAVVNASRAADRAAAAATEKAAGGLKPMIQGDIGESRRLDRAAHALEVQLSEAGDKLAQQAIEKLYEDTRKVLDKAKLGKIDAIIGQKRKLDIEVQDLAAGRFPEELIGKMWNASMIGDDEEYWPWQGEFWADEYEGWR